MNFFIFRRLQETSSYMLNLFSQLCKVPNWKKIWDNESKFRDVILEAAKMQKQPLIEPVGLLWSLQKMGLKYRLDCKQNWG